MPLRSDRMLFWGCFTALVTTSFGFLLRIFLMDGWKTEFNMSETQKGELFGAGLWPFAISIILFSLIIDRIGYKTAMLFGLVCHVISVLLTVTATSYEQLYWAMFIVALGNGTVEAYINPVVAAMKSEAKTRWLNILHAGWPAGFVVAGLLALWIGNTAAGEGHISFANGIALSWQGKMCLLLIPAAIYAVILIIQKFPVSERVSAGIPYRAMLESMGALGGFIVIWLIAAELAKTFNPGTAQSDQTMSNAVIASGVAAGCAVLIFVFVRKLGDPLFLILGLLMIPLATTELGVDSWVSDLLAPTLGGNSLYVLLYTSALMMGLRFAAGGILHAVSPLVLLIIASLLATAGLFALSMTTGAVMVFAAATIYAAGKAFFWPTMLGLVAERVPRGGALTLNATGGIGMLGVGILGAALIGNLQDRATDHALRTQQPALHAQVVTIKPSLFGTYPSVDEKKKDALPKPDQHAIAGIANAQKQPTLKIIALLPLGMAIAYAGLWAWLRNRKPELVATGTGRDGDPENPYRAPKT